MVPVLRKRQVTHGGCVFLVQLENEYGGDAEYKREAIHKMYRMLRDRGIDVPLFTCNTPCAEDNDDPVMADINNGWDVAWCRWSTAESKVAENMRRVRQAEFNMPSLGGDIPGGGGLWAAFVTLPKSGHWTPPPLDWRDYDVTAKTVWMEGACRATTSCSSVARTSATPQPVTCRPPIGTARPSSVRFWSPADCGKATTP